MMNGMGGWDTDMPNLTDALKAALETNVSKLKPEIAWQCDLAMEIVTALTRLIYAAAPGFVVRGGGTIINIASVLAITPEVLNGVYGGTKAFVLALSLSLHSGA